MREVTLCVLSAIDPPMRECLWSVENQEGGPYRIIHVKDVFPMSAAFNEMIWRSASSRYVVQIDGDVVLSTSAVRVLYESIRGRPWCYMAWGQLYEEGFGLGGSVRIWRRWPLRIFRFRDRRCVDRDLHSRIRWTGMRRIRARWSDAPDKSSQMGIHFPRRTPFAKYSKAKADILKWRVLGRQDLVAAAMQRTESEYADRGKIMGHLVPDFCCQLRASKDALQDHREFTYFWPEVF